MVTHYRLWVVCVLVCFCHRPSKIVLRGAKLTNLVENKDV